MCNVYIIPWVERLFAFSYHIAYGVPRLNSTILLYTRYLVSFICWCLAVAYLFCAVSLISSVLRLHFLSFVHYTAQPECLSGRLWTFLPFFFVHDHHVAFSVCHFCGNYVLRFHHRLPPKLPTISLHHPVAVSRGRNVHSSELSILWYLTNKFKGGQVCQLSGML